MSFLAQSLRPLGEGKARKCLQLLIVVGRRDIDERAPDVAIDNFLSGFQDVGNFIKNVLPRSVPETTR